ncbi:5-oxoprolinase subunit PxpA [Sediminicola luteus]|uniref:Lactam utilization protein LamB n=1 Tax=Sediminicola luteus TaxID=319238 RepID=A0A2A4G8E1_9FLAO|nr:5-oxoprolinase subunit PxpA [Sediminicola luteus]PCE64032.1 hypothetical protein B7P33_12360 [Sediminicola luteus]
MDVIRIDINGDVAEGIGNEKALFPYISSCNICCGAHAGSVEEMTRIIRLAHVHQLKIGAHPGYPDRVNFGRKRPENSSVSTLMASIESQLRDFQKAIVQEGAHWHHIKPHGALYNDLAFDTELMHAFLKLVARYKEDVALYVLSGSPFAKLAKEKGFKVVSEVFADRNYTDDLTLCPRSHPDALIRDPEKVFAHIVPMAKEGLVRTLNGQLKALSADTFCVHGDTPEAVAIIKYLKDHLANHNITLA